VKYRFEFTKENYGQSARMEILRRKWWLFGEWVTARTIVTETGIVWHDYDTGDEVFHMFWGSYESVYRKEEWKKKGLVK